MGDTTCSTKIFVGGLSWQTQKATLRSYFEQFGEVEEAVVIIDRNTGRSKGYGFVTFKDAEAAERACGDPSPLIDGRKANCNLAYIGAQNKKTPPPRQYQPVHQQPFSSRPPQYAFPPPFTYQPPQSDYCYPLYSYLPNSSSYPPLQALSNVQQVNDMNPRRNLFPPFQTEPPSGLGNQFVTYSSTNIPFRLLQMAKELGLGPARHKNFVFSPGPIQLALSFAANGSTSSTLNEFFAFLEAKDLDHLNSVATELIASLTGTTEGGAKLSFAGGAWVDESMTLKPPFKDKAARIYKANAEVVDFQNNIEMAIDKVNKWAEAATNGLINSILPLDLPNTARVVLANALYFKGAWSRKFDEQCTRKSTFYLLDGSPLAGSSIVVPFMTSQEKQEITTFPDFKILRLPYETVINSKTDLSMYIILPNQVDGIWSLIENVGSDPLFFDKHLRPGRQVKVGEFRIPKFKMTYDFEASEVLQRHGLKRCFSDNAEFDEMVEVGKLKISYVFHKAQIEVNEEGTEAAAATAAVFEVVMCAGYTPPPRYVDFVADHPFMFVVRDDKSGMVLFMGHIINPLLT